MLPGESGGVPASVLESIFGGDIGNQLGTAGIAGLGVLRRLAMAGRQQAEPGAGTPAAAGSGGAPLRPEEAGAVGASPTAPSHAQPIDWLESDPEGEAEAERQRRNWAAGGQILGGVLKLAAAAAA